MGRGVGVARAAGKCFLVWVSLWAAIGRLEGDRGIAVGWGYRGQRGGVEGRCWGR